jgi:hypothetical protein
MAERRRTDNTMAERRTDNTMAERRTDNTMAERKSTNNDVQHATQKTQSRPKLQEKHDLRNICVTNDH